MQVLFMSDKVLLHWARHYRALTLTLTRGIAKPCSFMKKPAKLTKGRMTIQRSVGIPVHGSLWKTICTKDLLKIIKPCWSNFTTSTNNFITIRVEASDFMV